jgi:HD-like signal output (HDOD) protein/CheY-like chemotaxis protein
MKRILFVDDEVRVLQGLGRMLRVMRHEWEMTFEHDPCAAVGLIEQSPFDAIVVDMRMPVMDGAALLEKARNIRPGMARIVLSGHAEHEVAMRSVGLAHQFLAKPCDAEMLRSTVARACELRRLLEDGGLANMVSQLGRLPSLPHLYQAITDEMNREDVSLRRVAAIIGKDLAMTAKVLQLVNSAFFGLGRRVLNIEQAVSYLGVDVIRALVVSQAAFSAFEAADLVFFDKLWEHSYATGTLAKQIATQVTPDVIVHGEAMQAGMLHDIGALVLAARLPETYRDVWEPVLAGDRDGPPTVVAREQALLGADHGPVGAYLMGLWGLSDRIVEAIAYHDYPSECSYQQFSPLTAVHVASTLLCEAAGLPGVEGELDMSYLSAVGCAERVAQWREDALAVWNHKDEQ